MYISVFDKYNYTCTMYISVFDKYIHVQCTSVFLINIYIVQCTSVFLINIYMYNVHQCF